MFSYVERARGLFSCCASTRRRLTALSEIPGKTPLPENSSALSSIHLDPRSQRKKSSDTLLILLCSNDRPHWSVVSSAEDTPDGSGLVLGPILRYVDADFVTGAATATIWVQTAAASRVRVDAGDISVSADTFNVHGHHYALVDLTGLPAGRSVAYSVWLDDRRVWPATDSDLPASTITTAADGEPVRLLWGSCRRDADHGSIAVTLHGADSLRAYADKLATSMSDSGGTPGEEPSLVRPDRLLLIGDQIYADEPSEPMREFLVARRDVSEPPGEELVDYAEYAESYRRAWSEPTIRWLLSCVPSLMIFDDHDVRDDWNTSASWREEMRTEPWWRGRIVAGLTSYWVYQHAGNLSRRQRQQDAYGRLLPLAGDIGTAMDTVSATIDDDGASYRWSYSHRLGSVQLLILDSRCGRALESGKRDILNSETWEWLEGEVEGCLASGGVSAAEAPDSSGVQVTGAKHLVLVSSVPVLLPPTLYYAEQWNEAVCEGAWGRRFKAVAERLRQGIDLEHWAAFRRSFARMCRLVTDVAEGRKGDAPATIQFFGGDVHFSYLMRAKPRGSEKTQSSIYQVVCSPIRNQLHQALRYANVVAAWRWHTSLAWLVARLAGARKPPLKWRRSRGLWFNSAIALSEFRGSASSVRWYTAEPKENLDGARASESASPELAVMVLGEATLHS